jgi:hypothetical protein
VVAAGWCDLHRRADVDRARVVARIFDWRRHTRHTRSRPHNDQNHERQLDHRARLRRYFLILLPRPSRNGQTLGKHVLGIRVVQDNGQPVDYATVMRRDVPWKAGLSLLSAIGGPVIWLALGAMLLDCMWPLWDPQNRALHDFTAFTHVIRLPQSGRQITLPVES